MTQPTGTWNWHAGVSVVIAIALAACSKADEPRRSAPAATPPQATPSSTPVPAPRPLSPAAQVGKLLFFDKALSASGQMACATCHDPAHAYGPPNDLAVQLGGAHGNSPGLRAVPSLRYKEFTPGYADLLDNPDGFSQPGPGGG